MERKKEGREGGREEGRKENQVNYFSWCRNLCSKSRTS
jgi:hypothetical protein